MKRFAPAILAFFLAVVSRAEPPEVVADITTTAQEELVLHLSFITNASPDKLWNALVFPPELTRWAAPKVHVELKIGGLYEHHYRPNNPAGRRGMEGTRITSFVPGKMLSYSGVADTWTVWLIEPAGDQQVLHFYMLGTSEEWHDKGPGRMASLKQMVENLAKYVQP